MSLVNLEALLEQSEQTIQALFNAGAETDWIFEIEHHFVSDSFDALEKAAVELVKAGLHVEDAEEFETEDGKLVFYCAAYQDSTLVAEKLAEQTKAMYELAQKTGVEYDGWGTYLGDDEDEDFLGDEEE